MEREDLAKFADVIYKRKEQRLDMRLTNQEQEFNRLFLWIMRAMEDEVERAYPPEGKIVRRFLCECDTEKRVIITCGSFFSKFTSIPTMRRDDFQKILVECVEFIEGLKGYGIINRFPKNSTTEVKEFMVVLNYSNYS